MEKLEQKSVLMKLNLISTINNLLKYYTKVTVPNSCEEFSWFCTMKLDIFKVSPFIGVITQWRLSIQNHQCRIQKCQAVHNMSRFLPHLRAWVMLSFSLTQKFGLTSVRLWTRVPLPGRLASLWTQLARKWGCASQTPLRKLLGDCLLVWSLQLKSDSCFLLNSM